MLERLFSTVVTSKNIGTRLPCLDSHPRHLAVNPSRVLWRSTGMGDRPFCPLLLRGNIPASRSFPEFQRADSVSASSEGRHKGKAVKESSAVMGRVLVLPRARHRNLMHIWVLLQELRSPPQGRLSTSMWTPDWLEPGDWWLRFLDHHPVNSPPTNQRKVTQQQTSPPNSAYRNSSLKSSGSLGLLSMNCSVLLAWPGDKPFSAPNSNFSVCLASLCDGYMNLDSTTL